MDKKKKMTMKDTNFIIAQAINQNWLASTDRLAQTMNMSDLENILEATDKQVPKKVDVESYFYGYQYYCPRCKSNVCNNTIKLSYNHYCSKCGQALDWSEV